MQTRNRFTYRHILAAALIAAGLSPTAWGAQKGNRAKLFASVDENLQPVDMKELLAGRPLVLLTGSAS